MASAAHPASTPAALRAQAVRWLAQRDHSRSELRDKLLHWAQQRARRAAALGAASSREAVEAAMLADADVGVDADADVDTVTDTDPDAHPVDGLSQRVEAVLDQLQGQGLLDDQRFAESRLHARSTRWGNRRIVQELKQHGVALDDAALEGLRQTEHARASALWQRHFDGPAPDAQGTARQMRFLLARGFSADVVRQVVRTGAPTDD